jgi:Winged helix DNA-binding domain
MDSREIAHRRLRAQRLVGPPLADPDAVVRHFGAVQAQEYAIAKWGVAQRTPGVTDAAMQRLLDEGAILRTHALRPTWHFLAADDIAWIQALTGPRVHAVSAYYNRMHGLDGETAVRTNKLITDALRGGNHLTRRELGEVLDNGGLPATGNKLAYVVMWAELGGLIASGPMRGKQHTYALISERAPGARELAPGAALAELTWRFFATHGPATVKDFAWWSSLTVSQIKQGLGLVEDRLASTEVEGRTVWFDPAAEASPPPSPVAHLLQAFDEYVVAYSDTKFVFNLAGTAPAPGRYTDNMMISPVMIDGQVGGFWRRVPKGKAIALELDLIAPTTAAQREALDAELRRHDEYAGVPLTVTYV